MISYNLKPSTISCSENPRLIARLKKSSNKVT